jgi:hypothetical protein
MDRNSRRSRAFACTGSLLGLALALGVAIPTSANAVRHPAHNCDNFA